MKKRSPTEVRPDRERYINREGSWLAFNERVLLEAARAEVPLLERLRFLSIFESNLDEFFMVRVSGLIEQQEAGIVELTPDAMTPAQQLELIWDITPKLRKRAWRLYSKEIKPLLEKESIRIAEYSELTDAQKSAFRERFAREIFPVCTPLALHPAHKVPFISNRSLNLAVELRGGNNERSLARVKVPPVLPRLYRIEKGKNEFVLLEDIIANHLGDLFPGLVVEGAYTFRVLRDADIEIQELEAADLISSIEQTIRLRRFGEAVMLEVSSKMPKKVRKFLAEMHQLPQDSVLVVDGLQGYDVFEELSKSVERPALRYPGYQPKRYENLSAESIFSTIRRTDILVHHPFDSFQPVEDFVASAAEDSGVLAIKQTLYRVGSPSSIVESLLRAAEKGKQVAVMVELKARFDESNNLVWARALERAGAHVSYGFTEMKTHCKLCLIVRKEKGQIRRYTHIATGNYNAATALQYTDLGLFTTDEDIAQDISELFNALTAYSTQAKYRKILVSPLNVREGIIDRIHREIKFHNKKGDGHIIFKANALVDPEVIDALYSASQAGVRVDLIIRGICCLRPGVKGLSENISVRSIIGRYLEHSRVYYFHGGGDEDVLIGSADLMRRNLDRRIEVLVPVERKQNIRILRDYILESYLRDNTNAWEMDKDGSYHRCKRAAEEKCFAAQDYFMATSPRDQSFAKNPAASIPETPEESIRAS